MEIFMEKSSSIAVMSFVLGIFQAATTVGGLGGGVETVFSSCTQRGDRPSESGPLVRRWVCDDAVL